MEQGMDFSLKGKVALVTGGSKGVGRAIASCFAQHGADVVIAARDERQLREAERIHHGEGRLVGVRADVAREDDLEALVATTIDRFGGVDILVNNAGLLVRGELSTLSYETFQSVMHVNVWAPLKLAQLCRSSMEARRDGVIINIASILGIRSTAYLGAYSLSKAALINASELIAKEWGKYDIRCVCLALGVIRTEMASELVKLIESGFQISPINRIGEAEDVAGLALYLASKTGRYATSATYVLDGGTLSMSSSPSSVGILKPAGGKA
jgi:NAD(P)-dependent dehydrogenase (short-subunit alcohol dehydrogenase family)